MKPCWIEVTILTSGEKELRNLAVFETIRTGEDGATEIWKDGRCARVRETPAQIWARIQEASEMNAQKARVAAEDIAAHKKKENFIVAYNKQTW